MLVMTPKRDDRGRDPFADDYEETASYNDIDTDAREDWSRGDRAPYCRHCGARIIGCRGGLYGVWKHADSNYEACPRTPITLGPVSYAEPETRRQVDAREYAKVNEQRRKSRS